MTQVDVLGLVLSREEFEWAIGVVYSGDFAPLKKYRTEDSDGSVRYPLRERTDEIRRLHEAELIASGYTLADLPAPDPHLRRASNRVKVNEIAPGVWAAGKSMLIPTRWAERLEHDQSAASCCRHPENHTLSAWYSSAADAAKGVPDIYFFHCNCGRVHRRFCVGGSKDPYGEVTAPRPKWDIR